MEATRAPLATPAELLFQPKVSSLPPKEGSFVRLSEIQLPPVPHVNNLSKTLEVFFPEQWFAKPALDLFR